MLRVVSLLIGSFTLGYLFKLWLCSIESEVESKRKDGFTNFGSIEKSDSKRKGKSNNYPDRLSEESLEFLESASSKL